MNAIVRPTIRLRVVPRLIPLDGKSVEMQATDTAVQWRLVGTDTWQDLVSLSDITGPKGDQGPGGVMTSVVAGSNITVDSTDPANPIITATADMVTTNNLSDVSDATLAAGNLGLIKRDTVALLQADEILDYSVGTGKTAVTTGQIIEAGGHRYKIAASDATDHHLETAGGVKLYALGPISPQVLGGSDATAINAAASLTFKLDGAGILNLPAGNYTADNDINLAGYAYLRGEGDRSLLTLSDGAEIVYEHDASLPTFDDHSHKILEGFRVVGDGTADGSGHGNSDGTTTGYHHDGSSDSEPFSSLRYMVFQDHDTGVHYDHVFLQSGFANHFKRNRVGLSINGSNLTAEYSSYFRFNSEAAIDLKSNSQDAIFVGCGIEGNTGRAIRIAADVPAYAHYVWQNCYFELNGNLDNSIPAIENMSTERIMLEFRNCNLWNNTSGSWKNGVYKLGKLARLSNCRLDGYFEVEEVAIADGCYLANASFNGRYNDTIAQQPALVTDWETRFIGAGAAGNSGYAFQLPISGGKPAKSPVVNGAPRNYPHITAVASGVVVSENTDLDYGEGSFTKVAFTTDAGSYSANYASISTHTDAAKEYRLNVFYLYCEDDTTLRFVQSGGLQNVGQQFAFTGGKLYKLMVLASRTGGAGTTTLRMFPKGTDSPIVSILPLWSTSFESDAEASRFINRLIAASNSGLQRAEAQADSAATDVAGVVDDLNSLLAKLRTAGLVET